MAKTIDPPSGHRKNVEGAFRADFLVRDYPILPLSTRGGPLMQDMELRFSGSVPASYDRFMVPLIFRPYAEELARRAREFRPSRIRDCGGHRRSD